MIPCALTPKYVRGNIGYDQRPTELKMEDYVPYDITILVEIQSESKINFIECVTHDIEVQ